MSEVTAEQRLCYCGRPMHPTREQHDDEGDPWYCYPEERLDDESRCTAMEDK